MHTEEGKVSVWVNIVPPTAYPSSYFEEDYGREDGPLCEWAGNFGFNNYDHDSMDVARTDGDPLPIRKLLKNCSYATTFMDEAERAAAAISLTAANHAVLLYDFDYAARSERVEEDGYMRFLGTFSYDDAC